MEDLFEAIIKEAEGKMACEGEEFNPNDNFGGNMDDAYWGGFEDGKIQLARELLELINNK